jgi:hypothetical protein
MDIALKLIESMAPMLIMAWVARGVARGDKQSDRMNDMDKRVSVLEEHREFLNSLMAKIDARFDKLESKLEAR